MISKLLIIFFQKYLLQLLYWTQNLIS